MSDSLGDRIKALETVEVGRRGEVGRPIYIRVDGNRFSRFTKGMDRPFDQRMSQAMIETAADLVKTFGAILGYTQSDEISLVLWHSEREVTHGGRYQKLVSRTASRTTAMFRKFALANGLEQFVARQEPEFDSRAFAMDSLEEVARVILWRELDAVKNAVSMTARSHYSHRQLHLKNTPDMLGMLAEKGVDFRDYPESFQRGTYLRRVTELRQLSPEEMSDIPEAFRPTEPVLRSRVAQLDLPRLTAVDNLVEVLFPATLKL